MNDELMARLRRGNPVPGDMPPLPIEPVLRRFDEAPTSAEQPRRQRPSRPLVSGAAVAVLVTLSAGIGLGAVVLLHHRQRSTVPVAITGARAQPLLKTLSVLRRPRTSKDLPPALGRLLRRHGPFSQRPVLSLVRLATVTPWGAKVFLIPVTPVGSPGARPADRKPRPTGLDQLENLESNPDGTWGGSCCATAASIRQFGISEFGGSSDSSKHDGVLVVPDGVAKVTVLLPRQAFLGAHVYARPLAISAVVHGNVAAFQFARTFGDPFKYMMWYDRRGAILKRFGNQRNLTRVLHAPKPAPPTALSRAAEKNPSTSNPVAARPANGGPSTRFLIDFRSLLNRAAYEFMLTGPNGPQCQSRAQIQPGEWIDLGAPAVRGQLVTRSFSPGYAGRTHWCPGTYRIAVSAHLLPGSAPRGGVPPFGAASFTVRR